SECVRWWDVVRLRSQLVAMTSHRCCRSRMTTPRPVYGGGICTIRLRTRSYRPVAERSSRMSVGAYLVRRLVLLVISLFVVLTLAFLLVALIPSNPAVTLAGPYATPQQVADVEHRLGLDQPLATRYFRYMSSLLHAD